MFIQPEGRAARETLTRLDGFNHIRKQFRAGMRVSVHEHHPVASGLRRAGIPRPRDLINWLKYDGRASSARDLRRAVGGVVVAHDHFHLPTALRKGFRPRLDARERFAEQPFLVERRDDDGNFHCANVAANVSSLKLQSPTMNLSRLTLAATLMIFRVLFPAN